MENDEKINELLLETIKCMEKDDCVEIIEHCEYKDEWYTIDIRQRKNIDISISYQLYKRLDKERADFEINIGGESWTIEDAIWEFIKIAGNK